MTSTERRYFYEQYATSEDPWGFASRWYERRKYALTVAALPRARYARAFEPGCSIGVLSELLAARCDHLLACDIVPSALEQAAARLVPRPNVVLERRAIPEAWPTDIFDLIVLSEIAYYFDAAALAGVVAKVVDSTVLGAHLVAVHWRGPTNYALSAAEVHAQIDRSEHWQRAVHYEEENFILDVWERVT